VDEYDMCLNTDRIPVPECVDWVLRLVKSPRFAETEASRAKLRDVALVHHVRAALRIDAATAHCRVLVGSEGGRVTLEGVVDRVAQSDACTRIASGLKGVVSVDNRLRTAEVPARLRG
jgi:hypothetical protein